MKALLLVVLLLVGCSSTGHVGGGGAGDAAPIESGDSGRVSNGCGFHTAWAGDEACIPPSDDPAVISLHYGPLDYSDPVEVAKYTLAPSVESVVCKVVQASHLQTFVAAYEVGQRPGMHHFSLFTGVVGASDLCTMATNFVFISQREHEVNVMGDGAPEYVGSALQIPSGSFLTQAHAINTTGKPILVEGWINLTTVENTGHPLSPLGFGGGHTMAVPAHSKQIVNAEAPAIELPMTVVELVGHFHEHTTEQRASYNGAQIYVTDSWAEPTVTWYTSKTTGPLVVPAAPTAPGGYTGPKLGSFELTPATSISWQCDVNNTTNATLGFGNEATTSEMCNLGGIVDGVRPWVASVP